MTALGFHYNLPFADYAAAAGLNGSKIVYLRRSAMYYRYMLANPTSETEAMMLGTVTHRMVLEPSLIENIAVWGRLPEQKVRRGHHWEVFQAANQGATILTVSQSNTTTSMARACLTQAPIRKYALADGPTEVSMFWKDARTGRPMKARIDKLITASDTIADLKTTNDATPHRFGARAHDLGYVVKMAHYWDGYRTLTGREAQVKLLALESKAPHESVVYDIPRDMLLCGLEERDQLIDKLDECEKAGEWPAAEQEERFLELPSWAAYDMQDVELGIEA